MTTVVEAFVPAKVNLTLHVTGRRDDGYHTLDSLAMFADIGDRLTVSMPGTSQLTIDGPMIEGVPLDDTNLVRRAARMMDETPDISLLKYLPNAAGLGGGSGDAAATLRMLSGLTGKPVPETAIALGADVPVCLTCRAARMRGIGDIVDPLPRLPVLHAVLVNPNLPVLTAEVFKGLENRENPPMPDDIPEFETASQLIDWLKGMRNDLQAAAIKAEPVIKQVFDTLSVTPGCLLARMSGSGGTCFGLYADAETAGSAEGRLKENYPGWWVAATQLNYYGAVS